MIDMLSGHNTHWEGPDYFMATDPQLKRLKTLPYVFTAPLLHQIPITIPGIYTIGGGRQIGKTTLLKQWMQHLMQQKINPKNIVFLTGEIIADHYSLINQIKSCLTLMPSESLRYVIVDEVTYIKDWDKGIKFLADAGVFDDIVVVLTGSDLVLMQEARMRFPGRRGKADQVDFHLYPLSFNEFANLKQPGINPEKDITDLFKLFDLYLLHGGFLTAINDHAQSGQISLSTWMTYADWIRGDCLKRGKGEAYLKEILGAFIKTYGTQVTWNALIHQVSIDHVKTIQDYAYLLESMDALFIQSALLEHKLTAAPKKAKKIWFADPFIYHAINMWLNPKYIPLANTELIPTLVETCVITHIRRFYPTYYIKAEGEVDVAYVKDNHFFPVEIKWTSQLRSKDLKQIQKYTNGIVIGKSQQEGRVMDLPSVPLPVYLYYFN